MRNLAAHFSQGSRITFQFIRYYAIGSCSIAFEQLFEEFQRRLLIPLFRNENIQFIIVLIYSPPQVMLLSVDLDEDLIQKPLIAQLPLFLS